MADDTALSVYGYPDKLFVEVIGSDVAARTYPFSYVDDSEDIVTTRQPIDDGHIDCVKEALIERGYQLKTPLST